MMVIRVEIIIIDYDDWAKKKTKKKNRKRQRRTN